MLADDPLACHFLQGNAPICRNVRPVRKYLHEKIIRNDSNSIGGGDDASWECRGTADSCCESSAGACGEGSSSTCREGPTDTGSKGSGGKGRTDPGGGRESAYGNGQERTDTYNAEG